MQFDPYGENIVGPYVSGMRRSSRKNRRDDIRKIPQPMGHNGDKMAIRIFKKKITAEQAARELLTILVRCANDDSESDKIFFAEFNVNYDERIGPIEILHATISMELLTVKNISPELYKKVFNEIMLIVGQTEGLGFRSVQALCSEYLFQDFSGNLTPDEQIIRTFSKRMDFELGMVTGMGIRTLLLSKLGIWKFLSSQFRISI